VVGAQSTAVSVVGLVLGIPIGVILGRLAWRLISERVPLQDVPPVAGIALVVIVPLALVGANLLAAWPARRVARLRVAEVLRAE
jgi:ABC-type lipoprotein release transport system permease subunit